MSAVDIDYDATQSNQDTEQTAPDGPDYFASLKLVSSYIQNARWKLVIATLLATCSVALDLVPVWIVYRVISQFIEGVAFDLNTVLFYAASALFAVLCGYALMGFALGLSHIVAFEAIFNLRMAIARHMAKLPMGFFADRKSGDAKNLVVDEPERLELIIAHGLPEGVSAVATWIAVSAWLFVVDWRMALASIIATPISVAFLITAMRKGARLAKEYQESGIRMNSAIVEYLAGMPVIKIFNKTGESFSATRATVEHYVDIETRWAKLYVPLAGTFFSLVLASIVFILPVGLFLLAAGEITLPTLVFFIILGSNYSQPMMKLFNQFHTLAHISMGSTLIQDVLDTPPQQDSGSKHVLNGHDVAFNNVSFGYEDHDVVRDISFTAKEGSVTALVGPSGSGKSTIASLVPRFWDVRGGVITIGETDIRDIGLDQLMDTIAFVFQNTFLFSDTIAANIRFGNPDANDEEVVAAAKAARAHDFIMSLPDGYETDLGEQAKSLSGGERQRIAIARAILKDAPIVVLDEATAFADPDNEAAIQEAIEALTVGRTLILIAHRLHTIAGADQIVVVDDGRISEIGQHDELLEAKGKYHQLWQDYNAARSITLKTEDGNRTGADK